MKVKLTVTLLSKENGKVSFSEDCLKDVAKQNKELDSELGKITNIRYDKGRVIGDLNFSLIAATNGFITGSIDTLDGTKRITNFTAKDVKIMVHKIDNGDK